MKRPLSLFLGSTALAAALSLTAAAQEYSDGGCCHHDTCPAIISPVEAYGIHAPGDNCCRKGTVIPYYAPLAPTPTCWRFRTTHYTPYYCGYCAHTLFGPKGPPYGCDVCGPGPGPDGGAAGPGATPLNYGPYTAVLKDDTAYWNMGGNGLVPYGTPPPPRAGQDLVDMIQATRGTRGACEVAPDSSPVAGLSFGTDSASITPPTEKPAR